MFDIFQLYSCKVNGFLRIKKRKTPIITIKRLKKDNAKDWLNNFVGLENSRKFADD